LFLGRCLRTRCLDRVGVPLLWEVSSKQSICPVWYVSSNTGAEGGLVSIFHRATSECDLLARLLSGRSLWLCGLVDLCHDRAGERRVDFKDVRFSSVGAGLDKRVLEVRWKLAAGGPGAIGRGLPPNGHRRTGNLNRIKTILANGPACCLTVINTHLPSRTRKRMIGPRIRRP
jgi:hypothetical protein